jgi:shikimate dehydrogenase
MDAACLIGLDALVPGWRTGTSLAVLGAPVRHSLSPAMHNAALAVLAANDARLADWRYFAVEVQADALACALPRLHAAGFAGLNLTMPHKVAVLPLLESVDEEARRMGAVNTLVRTGAGWRGANTDGFGVARALQEHFGHGFADAEVLLLGAGGAARAIAVRALADGCRRLTIANRDPTRLQDLCAHLQPLLPTAGRLRPVAMTALPTAWEDAPLVINATALGLRADDPAPIAVAGLPAGSRICDTTYGCANALRRAADAAGIAYADGLAMLVWQGARSLEIWTGASVPAATMAATARTCLAARTIQPG